MPIVLDGALTRLEDDISSGPNPWIRNSGTAGAYDEIKAGPRSIRREAVNSYKMWWESVRAGTEPAITNEAAYATSTNGVEWTKYASNPILSPTASSWENGEVAPTSVAWDPSAAQYVLYYHGGNNGGPRQIGRATSTDGIAWTKYASNPILTVGGAGANDQNDCADCKVVRLSATEWIMLYRGNDSGDTGRIMRATSTDGQTWAKTGTVLTPTGTGWEQSGVFGNSTPLIDGEGRWHMWYVGQSSGSVQTTGYAYSDDKGVTWTRGANNPVLQGNAEADSPDTGGAGDTLEATHDGDKVIVTYYGITMSGYTGAGGSPIRSICAAWLPLKQTSVPAKPGRFYQPGDKTALAASLTLLDNATFTIAVRFRCYEDDTFRHFYTEDAAFNKQVYFRLQSSGVIKCWFRTPTAFVDDLVSTIRYDDNKWHNVAMRRNSSASWDLIVDGAVVDSSTTNPGTLTGETPNIAYGNWLSLANEPLLGTIGRIAVWDGATLTLSEITAFLNNGTLPGAGSPLWWHNPGTASPETDQSGNGNTGTVTGTTVVDAAEDAGVTPVAGVAAAGVAPTAVAGVASGTKKSPSAAPAPVAVAGQAAGVKAAPAAASGPAAVAGAATGVKVAVSVGACPVAVTGAATSPKAAPGVATAPAGITGAATGLKVAPSVAASPVAIAGAAQGVKSGISVGAGGLPLAVTGRAAGAKVSIGAARQPVAAAGASVAAKIGRAAGALPVAAAGGAGSAKTAAAAGTAPAAIAGRVAGINPAALVPARGATKQLTHTGSVKALSHTAEVTVR